MDDTVWPRKWHVWRFSRIVASAINQRGLKWSGITKSCSNSISAPCSPCLNSSCVCSLHFQRFLLRTQKKRKSVCNSAAVSAVDERFWNATLRQLYWESCMKGFASMAVLENNADVNFLTNDMHFTSSQVFGISIPAKNIFKIEVRHAILGISNSRLMIVTTTPNCSHQQKVN